MAGEGTSISQAEMAGLVLDAFRSTSGNALSRGAPVFDEPLVGVAAADDPIFATFKDPQVIGPTFLAPGEWLPGAQSVVAAFFPFTEGIRVGNRAGREPSHDWLEAPIVGQAFIFATMRAVADALSGKGFSALVPSRDERFGFRRIPREGADGNDFHIESAWSERHAAYACGLGTFGLSRGLITERGMAGRFGSVVTCAPIEPTPRTYARFDEWCTRCGACVRRCPVDAISLEAGKNNALCETWCRQMESRYHLYDGCGKCQVRVPCEFRRPPARSS